MSAVSVDKCDNVTARRTDKKREKKFSRRIIIFIFQKQKRQGNPQSCFTDPPAALQILWPFYCHLVAFFERTNKLVSRLKSIMILNRPFRTSILIRKNKSCIFAIKCLIEQNIKVNKTMDKFSTLTFLMLVLILIYVATQFFFPPVKSSNF